MEEKLLYLGLYLQERGNLRISKGGEFCLEEDIPEKVRSKLLELAEKEVEKALQLNIKILYYQEESFPQELKSIPYSPLFIYLKGELPKNPKLAIVGSRKPTPYGREVAKTFASYLSEKGICLVSGLARGIDTLVHKEALKGKGKTIAVLGSGLDIIYPPENKELLERIMAEGGAVLSEFPLSTKPKKENFPRRNRLISGLAKGVLVIEAGAKSGTLITAKWAQEQGKEVFAIPGNIFSEQSQGTHYLLKEGAIPITHPMEILEYLGVPFSEETISEIFSAKENLSKEEKEVLSFFSSYPLHFEELVEQTQLPPSLLLQILSELEIKNLILSLPGNFYKLR